MLSSGQGRHVSSVFGGAIMLSPSYCCSQCWAVHILSPAREEANLNSTSLPCFHIHTDLTSNPESFYSFIRIGGSIKQLWQHGCTITPEQGKSTRLLDVKKGPLECISQASHWSVLTNCLFLWRRFWIDPRRCLGHYLSRYLMRVSTQCNTMLYCNPVINTQAQYERQLVFSFDRISLLNVNCLCTQYVGSSGCSSWKMCKVLGVLRGRSIMLNKSVYPCEKSPVLCHVAEKSPTKGKRPRIYMKQSAVWRKQQKSWFWCPS